MRHPISANLPPFQLHNHNYSDNIATADKTKLQLSKSVNLSISRKTVCRSMAEYLSHKRLDFDSSADNTFFALPDFVQSPLAIVSMVISVIALFLTIVYGMKLRAMSLALFAARPTTALPTHFNFNRTTPSSAPIHDVTQSHVWTPYNIFLMSALLVIVVAMVFIVYCIFTERYYRH